MLLSFQFILLSLVLVFQANTLSGQTASDADGMRTLYIVRHAKSDQNAQSSSDLLRPLNDKGIRNATDVGLFLNRHGIRPDAIIASPSARTQQTAHLIAEGISFPEDSIITDSSIYRCNLTTYLGILHQLDDSHTSVMLIGHNPSTTQLANWLQAAQPVDDFPTGGILAVQFDAKSWADIQKHSGIALFLHDPDQIPGK